MQHKQAVACGRAAGYHACWIICTGQHLDAAKKSGCSVDSSAIVLTNGTQQTHKLLPLIIRHSATSSTDTCVYT
eukprot:1156388-Pelagomonas_calceolata.AAC.7